MATDTGDSYAVFDVPFSDSRTFDTWRPIFDSFGVHGRTLVVTVDDIGPQTVPTPSTIPDGRPDNPRDVVMRWDGTAYRPRVGDYRW
jgi:hypothetical protein